MTFAADERLLAPYRPVRRVSAGDDAPWAGLLVRLASGESRILVDAVTFDHDWPGWKAPPDGHLLAPLDVIRRSEGHDVMLPVCAERVEDFLTRRKATRVPLSVGETVTLGVSLVRGFAAGDAIGRMTGEWWLTDAGCPMLAAGASDRDVAAHTGDLLRALAADSPCASALDIAADAVGAPRLSVHDLREAEDALFAVAAAEPLVTAPTGPRTARELVAMDRTPVGALDDGVRSVTWVDVVARQVDSDLADAVSRATTGLWRRFRTGPRGPRRPWLVATGAAGVVLAAGLLWPTGAGGPATADVVVEGGAVPTGTLTPSPTSDAVETIDESSALPADLVSVTDRLLTARLACEGHAGCLADVIVDPAASLPAGVIDLDGSQRVTTLLDDFGGVAVLRVDALEGTHEGQLVVIMLQEDRWLLRDIHAAKQP